MGSHTCRNCGRFCVPDPDSVVARARDVATEVEVGVREVVTVVGMPATADDAPTLVELSVMGRHAPTVRVQVGE